MQLRTRSWFIISLLCFIAAAVFWQLGERKKARDKAAREAATAPAVPVTPAAQNGAPAPSATATNAATNPTTYGTNDPLRFRLSNTPKSFAELSGSDQAVLLKTAWVDSSVPANLAIPPHLRAQGDPGSFVVQCRGPLTDAYREMLRQLGAEVIAYVPNNAYLVRANDAVAQQLAASPQTQTVLPWEPYYKLDFDLLELAVDQTPFPTTRMLNLLVFSGERQSVEQALTAMNVVVVGEDRSPFGIHLIIRPRPDSLVALAQLPGVQAIESYHPRVLANDLARVRLRVSTNSIVTQTFLNLTGEGVLVNVNDSGVQAAHPDLAGRVFGDSAFTLEDFGGHGTHVAGTIASSGANGPAIPPSNVPGSVSNANFRGMAPGASIFALPLNIGGPLVGDTYFQENAAATNAFISNNSWGYNGSRGYTLTAASWDAAVRDALPGVEGSQPLLAVFAAGNSGEAGIDAPATAKNVITVGAIENMRYISNIVTVIEDGETNRSTPWLGMTDTNNEVANFSSVGNVGRRREGDDGRFKPDVVAPGTFTVSTRSSHWVQPTNLFSVENIYIPLVTLRPGASDTYSAFVPRNGVRLEVRVEPNQFTTGPGAPLINIHVQAGTPPVPPAGFVDTNNAVVTPLAPVPEIWYVNVQNPGNALARFDLRILVTTTNNLGDEPEVLFNLNQELAPHYRYESGTSMAAPAVSGVLALMHEHFIKRGITNSPALMKALIINGARNVNNEYDFDVGPERNRQGWGLVNLTNNITVDVPQVQDGTLTASTMVAYDQSLSRALATGQSFTRVINLAANARTTPLRFTLAWTDPPGNPAVGIKLVNDLDLIVTNMATKEVYVGNAFGSANLFSPVSPTNSLDGLLLDRVNNVENVYLNGSFSQRLTNAYSVTVAARRVNVNAITAHPDGVVQDFALVISSGNPRTTTGAAITAGTEVITDNPAPEVTSVTNGIPLLNQRVSANSPLLAGTNGAASQWHFFVVTNRLPASDPQSTNAPITAATNIAFATFLPPNLSLSRTNGSDIDLFVSQDPDLTNLTDTVIAASRRSVRRGGSEAVVFNLSDGLQGGEIFYAGVKSEDQQAANFGFFAVSSSSAFSETDSNGVVYLRGYPFNVEIPDGTPAEPQAGFMFAFYDQFQSMAIQNVVVTNYITHTNGGDLFGVIQLDGNKSSVLNANRAFSSLFPFPTELIYDDSGSGEIPESSTTDTPGTLRNFVGEEVFFGSSLQLTMVDSAPGGTGQVNSLFIRLEPRSEDLTNGIGVVATIRPQAWFRTAVDVPADATNLLVCVEMDDGPLEVYIARGMDPDQTTFDTFAFIPPPGDCLALGRRDVPPLSQGRYFIGIFNPNTIPVTATIRVFIQRDLAARSTLGFRSDSSKALLDDAVTNSLLRVTRAGTIADLSVGVRIDHPRASDLVLHLISPSGTRLLLAENRGGPLGADYGFGTLQELIAPSSSTGDAQPSTNVLGPVETEGVIQVDYDFLGVPDRITIYYDNILIYDSGLISGAGTLSVDYGPGSSTNIVIVMNEGTNPNAGTLWTYTAKIVSGYVFATFTDDTAFAEVPIKFAIPPFTNFNYFATNYVTNGTFSLSTILNDGFDAAPAGANPKPTGTIFSGWRVDSGDIDIVYNGYGMCVPPVSAPNALDIDGNRPGSVSTNISTIPGEVYQLSFQYTRNPNIVGCVGCMRSAEIGLSGSTNFVLTAGPLNACANLLWRSTSYVFTATAPTTTLSIRSLDPSGSGGLFFDDIKIQGTVFQGTVTTNIQSGIYFQPEEPITEKPFGRLVGEEAAGVWELEIWDNRVGAALTNASLLAWKLNITYVNTNPPTVTLTNAMEFCSVLAPNETAYFLVNVPISAGAGTNIVTSANEVSLRYNGVGLPTGLEPPDTVFFDDEIGGTGIIDDTGWNGFDANGQFLGGASFPQIRPGRRYYLAVQNRFPDTNAFCIRVEFDSTSPTLVPITPITDSNIVNCLSGSVDASGVSYYAFNVSSNAIGAEFSLVNIAGGDVNLYVKRNLPVPRADRFFAKSENPTAPEGEFIQVADFTKLSLPGRWYLAVIGAAGTTYDVCAKEIPGPVIPIPVNLLYTNTVPTNSAQYYSVVITSNTLSADFRTLFSNGDVDLFISTNTMRPLLTSPTNAMFDSIISPPTPLPGNETIGLSVFDTNAMVTPGTWYIAVVNKDIAPVTYTVQVAVTLTNLDYITLISGVPRAGEVGPTNRVGYYRFDVSPDAIQAVFETFGSTTNDVDLYIRWGFPLPPPATNRFDFASTNTPSGDEWIALIAGDTNRLLRPGSYWIAVVPKDPNVVSSYQVRATQILRSEVTRLFSGLENCTALGPIDTNALHSGVHFYSFDVGTNAVQALFETYAANGNVDLYLQYGLPITNYSLLMPPSVGSSFVNSEQPGLLNESICLLTNSTPIALRAGTWYLAVVNRDTNDVDYCVRASAIEIRKLTDGVAQCRTVGPTNGTASVGIHYYSYTVPTNAVQTTFEAYNLIGNVDLYVTKAPVLADCTFFTASLGNFTAFSSHPGSQSEVICLATNSQPLQLSAGEWYVAVVNRQPTGPASYCVRATPLATTNFTAVTNGLSFCRSVDAGNGALHSGIDYYVVTVTNNPVLATFQTFNADGNVDLYVTRDLCFPNFRTFDHTLTNFPYASVNGGTASECITLDTNSAPVALTNGVWYVAVVNRDATNVNYCFQATQFDSNPIQLLTNNIARCEQVPTNNVGAIGVKYYVVNISTNALQATFEVYNANGNVDLYLQNGFCFQNRDTFTLAEANTTYYSTNSGTDRESICVHRGTAPLPLRPGEWHLAVVNREAFNVDFCVQVRELLGTDIIELTNRMDYSEVSLAPGAADYYRYNVSPDALQVSVQVFQMTENVDLFLDAGFCPENFANPSYSSTNDGTTNELIMVSPTSLPFPLTPGEWLIAVTNRGPLAADYTIRVTELFESDAIRLTNALPYAKTVAGIGSVNGLPADYYVYNVSSNAVRAQFEILSPSGDVNLIARKGLPFPTLANSSLVSSNSGLSDELIVIFNSSTPVALSPGDWYLAVLNATATDVSYSVVATEYSQAGTNVVSRGITLVSNVLCLSWSGVLTGVNYHVQGKANFSAPAWIPVSPTIKATSDTITWCITLPSPYAFFRLSEGLSPLSAGNPIIPTSIVFSGTVLTLQWNAPPNLRFVAEYTDTLFPTMWKPFPDYITSTNGVYTFTDDGTKTGGSNPTRYYRFFKVP